MREEISRRVKTISQDLQKGIKTIGPEILMIVLKKISNTSCLKRLILSGTNIM